MKISIRNLAIGIVTIAAACLGNQRVTAQQPPIPGAPSSWSIVASYSIPGKASGLAWDGTYIYFGIYGSGGGQVFKFNPLNGTNVLLCTGSFSASYGLSYKSPNLVNIVQPSSSSQPAQINEFNMSGTTVNTITLPAHYMSGVAYEGSGYWVCKYYPDPGTVYHINASGTVLSQFVPPNTQPWDICTHGSDLWIADYYANMLYKVSSTGTLLESHASQGLKPSGVVYDGTYLWYCDGELGQSSTLYKIDLLGSGTPVIDVPVTAHDYGTVTVGNSATWNCQVQNTGTANLVITSIGIPGGVPITTTFSTPATITPGGSVNIPLIWSPTASGPLNTQVSINSNDPIHPSVDVTLTGNGVVAGPHINILTSSYNWNERRKNAYSRWYLTVGNNGDQMLTITGLSMSDPQFIVDQGISLPVTIAPLQTVKIGLWYHPTSAGQHNGTLSIVSNDASQNPFLVDLTGTGVEEDYPLGSILWTYLITGSFDTSPKAIRSIPDITGDTVADVIVGSEDNYIRCFNGNASVTGDMLWETFIYSGSVYQQNAIAIINDINNDGFKDVIVGTAWGDRSVIALSGKTGAQLWKYDTHEFGDGGWIYQVDTKYDYDNDGFPDVLAAAGDDGNNTGPHRAFCLNGKTGLVIWSRSTEGAAFSVIGVADFTGDGEPDVVAGATSASQADGRVFGIDGSNGTLKWTYNPMGSSTWGLMQIDDITGDGIKDVASGDFSGHIYFHNAVTGSSVHLLSLPNDMILRLEDMGDVNSDGHPDILVAHSGAKGIVVNGMLNTILWQQPLADKSWNVANMGDINWDGVNDAAIGTLYVDNLAYFLNGITGNILGSGQMPAPVDALTSIPDIVGDASKEAVIGGRNGVIICASGGYDTTSTSTNDERSLAFSAKVYPNPCREVVHLSFRLKEASDVKVIITDIAGRILYTRQVIDEAKGGHIYQINRSAINTSAPPQGICIMRIETAEGNYYGKIIFAE